MISFIFLVCVLSAIIRIIIYFTSSKSKTHHSDRDGYLTSYESDKSHEKSNSLVLTSECFNGNREKFSDSLDDSDDDFLYRDINPVYSHEITNIYHDLDPAFSHEITNIHHNTDPTFSHEITNIHYNDDHNTDPAYYYEPDNIFHDEISNFSDNSFSSSSSDDHGF